MSQQNLYIYGAGGYAKTIADIAEDTNWQITAAIDKNLLREKLLDQYTVYMTLNEISLNNNDVFFIAIKNNEYRKRIAENELKDFQFINIQSNTSIVSKYAEIEHGTVIMPYAIISIDCQIGKHCIIDSQVYIENDCVIEDYTHISAGAKLSEEVLIGQGSFIGAGVIIERGINIGKWCTITAGSHIKEDVQDGAII